MLARLDKRESVGQPSANTEANTEHAYPIELEGMLSRLERRGSVTQANANLDQA